MNILANGMVATTIATTSIQVPVTSVEPLVQNVPQVVPVPMCNNILESGTPSNNIAHKVMGGIIGSMIGGDESTRRLMTGVGVMVGDHFGNKSNKVVHRTHCSTSWTNKLVQKKVGYRVTYMLDGQTFQKVMAYNPGSSLTIEKQITVDGPVHNLDKATPIQPSPHVNPIPQSGIYQHPYTTQ